MHHVQVSDFATFTSLSTRILDLPQTGSFWNTWHIAHSAACRPIERLYAVDGKGEIAVTSVYGFPGGKLKPTISEYNELPSGLTDFLSLALEARRDVQSTEVNRDVIDAVIALV